MIPQFYCSITGQNYLATKGGGREPIWHFIEGQRHYLISLAFWKASYERPDDSHVLWDCGAWTYRNAIIPPWSAEQTAEMYSTLALPGDFITSPDHIIPPGADRAEQLRRMQISQTNAERFLAACPAHLTPVAAVHGLRTEERIENAKQLLAMGYKHLAYGGVANKTTDKWSTARNISLVCKLRQDRPFYLHVFGVTGLSWVCFLTDKAQSYDGSSMYVGAFRGGSYWTLDNSKLKKYSLRKRDGVQDVPECYCAACTTGRAAGNDPRLMTKGLNNIVRATHNINVYIQLCKALAAGKIEKVPL